MESDLEKKNRSEALSNYPAHTHTNSHTQSVYDCVQFSWKFEHCTERGSGGSWSSLPIAVSVFII